VLITAPLEFSNGRPTVYSEDLRLISLCPLIKKWASAWIENIRGFNEMAALLHFRQKKSARLGRSKYLE
jgi:hypothetical protein